MSPSYFIDMPIWYIWRCVIGLDCWRETLLSSLFCFKVEYEIVFCCFYDNVIVLRILCETLIYNINIFYSVAINKVCATLVKYVHAIRTSLIRHSACDGKMSLTHPWFCLCLLMLSQWLVVVLYWWIYVKFCCWNFCGWIILLVLLK